MKNSIASILVIAALAIFWWYIDPTLWADTGASDSKMKSVKELRVDRDQYVAAIEKSNEIELARKGLLDKFNSVPVGDQDKLLKLLPDHIDSVRLIIDVNSVAASYGLSLKNLTVGDQNASGGIVTGAASAAFGPSDAPYAAMPLQFSISGPYTGFRSFLKDMEQSLRLADISEIHFTAADGGEYTYGLTINTYRLK